MFGIAVGALSVPLDPGGALVAFVAAIVVSGAIGLAAGFSLPGSWPSSTTT